MKKDVFLKPMAKVFIVGPGFPLRGGPAQFNENLCREFNKMGHDAQIISYSLQYPNFLFPGSSQYETSGSAPTDIKIHTLINTINPFNWFSVARFIKKEKPDFIIFRYWLPFFGPSLGTIGRLVRKGTNIKVLALTDNIIPHEKRAGDKPFTKYFVKACHGFITMSKAVFNDISVFTPTDKKVYSPHPMYETYGSAVNRSEARKKLGLNETDKVILFFGLIRKYKGLDILLEAMANEKIKNSNIKLLVAGEFYEDKQPYLDIIGKNGLEDKVLFHSQFIPNEEVRYYFCAADLVAQTYRNATNSGVTMVGYYYEKPMLVTDVGGLSELVPHKKIGYTVPIDTHQISECILDYFENDREREFIENLKVEKTKYLWPTFINRVLELYNRC
jgi:glycosyltransferase involved in cell wall biosynthesis